MGHSMKEKRILTIVRVGTWSGREKDEDMKELSSKPEIGAAINNGVQYLSSAKFHMVR